MGGAQLRSVSLLADLRPLCYDPFAKSFSFGAVVQEAEQVGGLILSSPAAYRSVLGQDAELCVASDGCSMCECECEVFEESVDSKSTI